MLFSYPQFMHNLHNSVEIVVRLQGAFYTFAAKIEILMFLSGEILAPTARTLPFRAEMENGRFKYSASETSG